MAMRRSKGVSEIKRPAGCLFSPFFALLSHTSLKDHFIMSLYSKGNAEGLLE